jgi:hypothetical protein
LPALTHFDVGVAAVKAVLLARVRAASATHFIPRPVCRVGLPRITSWHGRHIAESRFVLKLGGAK